MGRRFIDIVYDDRDFIVVNKPRGIEVKSMKKGAGDLTDEVHSYLLSRYKGARGAFVKPVHRLDKETTGLVIFAKSKTGEALIDDIKEHRVERRYIAVVEGAFGDENGTINLPIEKGDFGHGRKAGISQGGGKDAVTHFRVIERYEDATLIKIWLETGRTHQIRIHMSSIGYPIVGDKVYNPHGRIKFPRQALHAAEIIFRHPSGGKKVELSVKLPRDMEELVDHLRGD